MDAFQGAGAAMAVSATAYLRRERFTFRLLPVPSAAVPGWNARIARHQANA